MNVEQFQAFVKHGNFTKDERDSKFLAAMGLAGEAGEVCDLLKKHLLHGKELDRDELNKELGDVLWYLFHAFNAFGFTFEEVAEANVEKLCNRYPRQYGFPEDWMDGGVEEYWRKKNAEK
jgi:NTP pyrophosphatase (non-canonical NTP hydrolase)